MRDQQIRVRQYRIVWNERTNFYVVPRDDLVGRNPATCRDQSVDVKGTECCGKFVENRRLIGEDRTQSDNNEWSLGGRWCGDLVDLSQRPHKVHVARRGASEIIEAQTREH
jgi:hypothetical protein